MVAEVDAATALVVTVNVTLVAPAGTVTARRGAPAGTSTRAGRGAAELFLDGVSGAPRGGAAPFGATARVGNFPPMTLGGLTASDTSVTAAARVVPSSTEILVES